MNKKCYLISQVSWYCIIMEREEYRIKGDKFPGKHELNLVSMDSLVLWSDKLNGD